MQELSLETALAQGQTELECQAYDRYAYLTVQTRRKGAARLATLSERAPYEVNHGSRRAVILTDATDM